MRNWMKAVAVLAVLGLAVAAIAQTQIEGYKLRVNTTGYTYAPLVPDGAASSVTSWSSLDSGQTDTSVAYKIVPGCYVNVTLKTDAAADTILTLYAYGSQDGGTASWFLLDSLLNITSVSKSRTLMGTAAAAPALTAGNPILFRYVIFTVKADGDAAADTVNVTGTVVTTPSTND